MVVTDVVITIAFLCMVVAAILGLIGLINPKWFGIQTRRRSSAIFFGISFACLVIEIALAPGASQKKESEPNTSKSTENNSIVQVDEERINKPVKTPVEYEDLMPLLIDFNSLTEIQKKEWNDLYQWKQWVKGRCVVSEVNSTNMFSEIKEATYVISCEFTNQDRAILFFSKHMRDQIVSLNKGEVIEFKGILKNIKDWGFWRSGYVKVD